jgi:flagellar biogenesis protein FliO
MVFGFPLLLLAVVGLLTIMAFKTLLFVVLPIVLVIWAVRRLMGPRGPSSSSL